MNNSPGIITKLQSPSNYLNRLELEQQAFIDKLKAAEQPEISSNLAAAFAQAKLILPKNNLKATHHLSNSMKELCISSDQTDNSKNQGPEKGFQKRKNSIRQWVAGATNLKKYSSACKQLKENLSRESSLEKSDLTTSVKSSKNLPKITTSSSLLPQLSLKDDSEPQSNLEEKQIKKRRMSTFTDWKPSFGTSSPFNLASRLIHDKESEIDKTKTESKTAKEQSSIKKISSQMVFKNQEISEQHDKSVHLNKLDEEIEEDNEGITELSSPQLSKRSSAVAIHEMKAGTSLSGVFYSSHSISNRKSSLSIQTQTSSRTSINSTGESTQSHINSNQMLEGNKQSNKCKLQRRSTLNVGQYSRRRTRLNKGEDSSDKEKDIQRSLDLETRSKRRSVSSDLILDTAFHSTLLCHHKQSLSIKVEDDSQLSIPQPTTSNYATSQTSPIVTQTIVEEVAQRNSNVVPEQHTAIDFNLTGNNNLPVTDNTLTTENLINTVISSRHSSYASSSSKHRSSTSKSVRSGRHSSSLEVPPIDQQTGSSIKTGSLDTTEQKTVPPRKFCIYFKWYDWMTKRDNNSLFIFTPDNKIRKKCAKITEHRAFDYVVLIFISLNCITLAMER